MKMHMIVLFLCVMVSSASAIESNFFREEDCAQVNGYCVYESECPHSVTTPHKGLCAMQKSASAVCCVDFPSDDANCLQQHHACRKACPKFLDIGRKGCSKEETCCVLI